MMGKRRFIWIAWPDAARSPWKRRLVWVALFMVVLAGVVTWRTSRPTLGEDVVLVDVSREEAAVLTGMVNSMIKARILDDLTRGKLRYAHQTITMERVIGVTLHSNWHAEVRTTFAESWTRVYHFERDGNGWGELLDIDDLIDP